MKTTIFLITVALLTTAASPVSTVPQNASQHLAEQIIEALRTVPPTTTLHCFPRLLNFTLSWIRIVLYMVDT